jgi:putative Mg2+ transporter-C (MgtC) family protein
MELTEFFGPRVLFSILCGGIVGLEREIKGKSAGLKTNILICLGSTLFSTLSILIANWTVEAGRVGDPGRLAAQIVSGIGFLGGGAIIQSRGTILGLTTAASIWMVAAIGVCIGIGYPEIAVGVSFLVVAVLVSTSWFENRILGRVQLFTLRVMLLDQESNCRQKIQSYMERYELNLEDFEMMPRGEVSSLTLHYSGSRDHHKKFVLDLWSEPGIREVREL